MIVCVMKLVYLGWCQDGTRREFRWKPAAAVLTFKSLQWFPTMPVNKPRSRNRFPSEYSQLLIHGIGFSVLIAAYLHRLQVVFQLCPLSEHF